MNTRELIEALQDFPSDAEVFVGSLYRDVAISDVVIEDGYPLILIDAWRHGPLIQF